MSGSCQSVKNYCDAVTDADEARRVQAASLDRVERLVQVNTAPARNLPSHDPIV